MNFFSILFASFIASITFAHADVDLIEENLYPIDIPQSKKMSTISNKEFKDLEKVYNKLYKGKTDAPSKKEVFKIVLDMASRPEVKKVDTRYKAAPCEVAVVVDAIALGLSAIGVKGGSGKKVAKKMYSKLPSKAKKRLIKNVKSINMKNFTKKIRDVLELIKENITWNALKDFFSVLGWWDAATFALSFVAIFVSGGTAFLINVGLLTYDATMLVFDIKDCYF